MPAVSGCPADLTSTGKARWRLARKAIDTERGWRDEYAPTLDSYIRALEVADKAWADLSKSGRLELISVGNAGQPVPAAEWKVWREAKAAARDFAAELGLTPKARAALGDATVKPSGGKFGL